MRPYIILSAAALVAASPAPTGFDYAAIENAPAPTGPAIGVASQDSVYDRIAAEHAAIAAAEGEVTDETALNEKRTFWWKPSVCWFWCPKDQHKPEPKPKPEPHHPKPEPHPKPPHGDDDKNKPHPPPDSQKPNPPAVSSTSVEPSSTTEAPTTTRGPSGAHEVPSTCTPVSWTNTFAFTTESSCPEPFEVGTFCGFINPEDPCAVQPDGFGPVSSPDTVEAFQNNKELLAMAEKAPTPKGYENTFRSLSAAVNANTYLGYKTLKTYDVQECANWCDEKELCTAFNIYIERDPKWNPEKCSCDEPESITNYKCSLWGSGVTPQAAVNTGQNRGKFEVVIIGSNGYSKAEHTEPETPEEVEQPQECEAVHDHPETCVGEHFFPGPYDVAVCAKYALAHNIKLKSSKHFSKSSHCSFFNAFMVKQNHVAKGTYCKLFSKNYSPRQATWLPGKFKGKSYSIESSWSFSLKK